LKIVDSWDFELKCEFYLLWNFRECNFYLLLPHKSTP
jgi:hypothetical protein